MPREQLPAPESHAVEIQTNAEIVEIERSARHALAAAQDRAVTVAQQVGYDGPISVDALDDGIHLYQRRTVEDCLELGKRLLVRRELTPHGEWTDTVERLGFSYRTANRFMQAALKTAKSANLADLAKRSRTAGHYLELLTLDDEEAEILADGGSVAGVTLDEIDRLSVSELRKRLREARDNDAARDKILSDKSRRIDDLETKLETAKRKKDEPERAASPDARLESLEAVLTHHRSIIEVNILGPLKLAAAELLEASREAGQSKEEIVSAAFLQLQRSIEEARLEVGVKAMPTGESDFPWLKEDWAQPGYVDPDQTH